MTEKAKEQAGEFMWRCVNALIAEAFWGGNQERGKKLMREICLELFSGQDEKLYLISSVALIYMAKEIEMNIPEARFLKDTVDVLLASADACDVPLDKAAGRFSEYLQQLRKIK